jgi:hypothetical protein
MKIVIPGCGQKARRPGIHFTTCYADRWIPGSRFARPGMTSMIVTLPYATNPFIGFAAALSGNTVFASTLSLMPR